VECSGYATNFIFYDETTRWTKPHGADVTVLVPASPVNPSSPSQGKLGRPGRVSAVGLTIKDDLPAAELRPALYSESDRLACKLIASFGDASVPRGKRLDAIALYILPFIPARLGISTALDDAVECLIEAHHSFLIQQRLASQAVMFRYGNALQSLKCVVEDAKARTTSETLCAAHILTLFEVALSSHCCKGYSAKSDRRPLQLITPLTRCIAMEWRE
jgi:hypothetical protein